MKKISLFLILFLTLALAASCAHREGETRAMAPGPVYSPTGELKTTLNAPLPKAYRASEAALRDMGIQITDTRADQLTGKVVGQLTDGRPVNIDLSAVDENRANVNIRVGTLGDEPFSRRILDQIEKDLPKF